MISRLGLAGCFVAGLLGLAGACKSTPLDSDELDAPRGSSAYPSYRPLSYAEFPAAFAAGLCTAFSSCCQDGGFAFDLATCERDVAAQVASDDDQSGPHLVFDPEQAAACIDDWANAVCPSYPTLSFNPKRNCNVFRGTVPAGGDCADNAECAFQDGEHSSCTDGRCVVSPAAEHPQLSSTCGGTCRQGYTLEGCESAFAIYDNPEMDFSLPQCHTSDGLQCAGAVGARTCQPLIAVGGSCAENSQACVHGSYCELQSRVCMAQTKAGPCDDFSNACTSNAACDEATAHCVVVGLDDGQHCKQDQDCHSGHCNHYSVCSVAVDAAACGGRVELP